MNTATKFAVAFAAGAVAMYFLDPRSGRRRRAVVRDRSVAAGHEVDADARARVRHAADRVQGMAAAVRGRVSNAPLDDDRLHARIRSRLGRIVEHPHGVEVEVHGGHVVLKGRASSAEAQDLMASLMAMRGVDHVDNRLSTGKQSTDERATAH